MQISGFIDLEIAELSISIRIKPYVIEVLYIICGKYGGKVYEGFKTDILFEELEIIPDWEEIKYFILLDEL